MKFRKLKITGIRKKANTKTFPKRKNWRSGYDPEKSKKSYMRWNPYK